MQPFARALRTGSWRDVVDLKILFGCRSSRRLAGISIILSWNALNCPAATGWRQLCFAASGENAERQGLPDVRREKPHRRRARRKQVIALRSRTGGASTGSGSRARRRRGGLKSLRASRNERRKAEVHLRNRSNWSLQMGPPHGKWKNSSSGVTKLPKRGVCPRRGSPSEPSYGGKRKAQAS